MIKRPKLGAKVMFSDIAYRACKTEKRPGSMTTHTVKRWVPFASHFGLMTGSSVCGIYVGYRTKQDGYTDCDDYEYGPYFVPDKWTELWMVVESPRNNPVFVFPEHKIERYGEQEA